MSSPRGGPGPADGVVADASAALGAPRGNRWRRRRIVVNRSYQFRVSFLAVSVVLALLLLLNLSLYSFSQAGTVAALDAAPELRELFRAQDRVQLTLTLLGSAVFLVGVFLVSLLESHRTAGAAFSLSRCLEQLGEGRFASRVRLRRGDNLGNVQAALNTAAARLQDRAREEADRLEALADRLDLVVTDGEARGVAAELRQIADAHRHDASR